MVHPKNNCLKKWRSNDGVLDSVLSFFSDMAIVTWVKSWLQVSDRTSSDFIWARISCSSSNHQHDCQLVRTNIILFG